MRARNLIGLFLSAAMLFAAGCGDSNSNSSSGGATVNGVASKGPIVGGTVNVFAVISSATTNPRTNVPRLATTPLAGPVTTGADGGYSLTLPANFRGSFVVKVTGADATHGTYKDEATGATKNLFTEFPTGLQAAASFNNFSGAIKRNQAITVNPTPITEVAYENAVATGLTDSQIATADQTVTTAFFGANAAGVNILTTKPLDATAAFISNADPAQKAYGTQLGVLSQFQHDAALPNAAAVTSALATDIHTNDGTITTNAGALATAGTNFANNITTNPNSPNAPASVTLTAPAQGVVGAPVALSATVVPVTGGTTPNGTVVTFAVTSGTGTISAVTTTTNGVATATLTNSTSATPVTVTASVAPATGVITSTPATVQFIVDPNQPTAVALSAPTAAFIGDNVTLTANVSPGTGGTIANGTVVTFTVTSGPGVVSAVTTTTNGVATATLTSASANTTTVTATVGGITSTPSSVKFNDPNAPGTVTLTASPTSGVATPTGAVTLSATVAPLSTGGTVPNGTVVTFAITSGTGVLSAVTTTTGGVATATLSAAAANTVTVTATAGTITSNAVPVNFIGQPTLVIVKVGTAGTLPTGKKIGGVTTTVGYPASGLTIQADTDVTTFGDIVASGVGANAALVGNTNVAGQVGLGTISTGGFLTGEFATLNFHVAPGTVPTANQFTIVGPNNVVDTGTNSLNSAITPVILSVTIQ